MDKLTPVVVPIAAALFALSALLSRAPPARIAAAAAGALVAGLLNMGWDFLAWRAGWWCYTIGKGVLAPLWMYAPAGLVFGGALGLIGWRAMRAYGHAGGAVFFVLFTALGVSRDSIYAARGTVFVFGDGWQPLVADACGYLSIAVTFQLLMFLLAGPPRSGRLRGRPVSS